MRHRREVRRIRLDEKPVVGHEPQQRVVRPLPERDDAAERDVPARRRAPPRRARRARVAVQHAAHAARAGLAHHRRACRPPPRACGPPPARRARRASASCAAKRRALLLARRVVVVVVEAALADGDRTVGDVRADRRRVARGVEAGGIVRMHAGGVTSTKPGCAAAIAAARSAAASDSPMQTTAAAPVGRARAMTSSRSASNAGSARWAWLSMNASWKREPPRRAAVR